MPVFHRLERESFDVMLISNLIPVRLHVDRPLVCVSIFLSLLPKVAGNVTKHYRLHNSHSLRITEKIHVINTGVLLLKSYLKFMRLTHVTKMYLFNYTNYLHFYTVNSNFQVNEKHTTVILE